MTTYTYRCNTCRNTFEVEYDAESKSKFKRLAVLGYYDTPRCRCGSSDTVKIIVPSAIIFKGDGFTKSTKED
jgi:predicted nucleic acid-binding Zn ribbon protein